MSLIWRAINRPGYDATVEPIPVLQPGDPGFPMEDYLREKGILERYDRSPVLLKILDIEKTKSRGESRAREVVDLLARARDERAVPALLDLLVPHQEGTIDDVWAAGGLHLQDEAARAIMVIGDESGIETAAEFCSRSACYSEKTALLRWVNTATNPQMIYKQYWTSDKLKLLIPYLDYLANRDDHPQEEKEHLYRRAKDAIRTIEDAIEEAESKKGGRGSRRGERGFSGDQTEQPQGNQGTEPQKDTEEPGGVSWLAWLAGLIALALAIVLVTFLRGRQ